MAHSWDAFKARENSLPPLHLVEPNAKVHHLLTGGVSSPSGVETTTHYRAGRHSVGDDHTVTLVVSDPDSVTNNDLVNAYRKEKSRIVAPGGGNQPKRARAPSKSERVAAFVEQLPDGQIIDGER